MPDQRPASILIVDDEESLMRALSNTLRESGYETAGFTGAGAALEALARRRFDLLLSDLTMPEMDGITMLRRGREADPEMVGIIMTGDGTIATAVEAMKSGAFDYILKPFRRAVILQVITRALAVRRLSQEKAALEVRVQERTAQLEAANQELEAFSYSISHDLRAPLRHIQGYAEMLDRASEGQLSEKAQRYLKTITEASIEMGNLIEDLLAFSRMGRVEMDEAAISLDMLVSDTIRRLEMATSGRNIQWKIAPLPQVLGDPATLRQVLANLIGNAVKYSRQRDPAEIEIGCVGEEDKRAVIFVRDNGAGFDMRYVQKLFGVFHRLHRPEEFEGTGIGLAIVRRIVARHGGRTWAEGAVNHGATFYFTLKPAVAIESSPGHAAVHHLTRNAA
jgi:two-component system, sensor histidine kinase and response regulator